MKSASLFRSVLLVLIISLTNQLHMLYLIYLGNVPSFCIPGSCTSLAGDRKARTPTATPYLVIAVKFPVSVFLDKTVRWQAVVDLQILGTAW